MNSTSIEWCNRPETRGAAGAKTWNPISRQYDQGAQRDQLTVLTGYKRSTRDAYIQRLKEKAFVTENGNGSVIATQAGVDALGSDFEPLPTGAELQEYWLDRLPEGERKIFAALLEAPAGLSRESLEELTGYKRSTRDAYIQRLQSRRLVEIMGRGEIRGPQFAAERRRRAAPVPDSEGPSEPVHG